MTKNSFVAEITFKYKTPDNLSSEQTWINTKNLSNITIIPSPRQGPAEISNSKLTYSVAEVFETQNISYENAKKHELASWKDNNVYKCVQNKNVVYCYVGYAQ